MMDMMDDELDLVSIGSIHQLSSLLGKISLQMCERRLMEHGSTRMGAKLEYAGKYENTPGFDGLCTLYVALHLHIPPRRIFFATTSFSRSLALQIRQPSQYRYDVMKKSA